MLRPDEMVEDVGAGRRASRVAEPFLAYEAFDDAGRVVYAAVGAGVGREVAVEILEHPLKIVLVEVGSMAVGL